MLSKQGCATRTERLLTWCGANEVDLAVISDVKNIYYFSGFLRQAYGWFIPRVELFGCFATGETILLCSKTMAKTAKNVVTRQTVTYSDYDLNTSTETYLEDALVPFREALQGCAVAVKKIALDKRYATVALLDLLNELFPEADLVDVSEEIRRMRRCKDDDEVELIKRAADLSGFCYRVAGQEIIAGKTEAEVYGACNGAYAAKLGRYVTFSGDFIAGERTLETGGPPTVKVLRDGETMILDLWIEPDGYWADSARSFIVGQMATSDQTKIYDLSIQALEAAEKMLKPGVAARDVYFAVCGVFDGVGLGEYFPLHAGHGIGLSPHEAPLFIPGSQDVIEEGMVCTVEPGLYVPEVGGVRCEDIYRIGADGPERLTTFNRKINWN